MKTINTALLGAFTFLCVATGVASAAEPGKPGGTMVIISSQVPRHFNPAVQSGTATAIPGTQIFATPLRFDTDWQPQPYLAKSWSVADDGLSITLDLVEDARFHDGKPITSDDVAFSVETVKANHPFKSMYGSIDRVETPDPQTAVLHFTQPHPAALLAMSSALLPIIPKHIYGDGQDPKSHPRNGQDVVGSGAFKLVEYKQGEYVILERNDDYFIKDRPYLDRIIIKIIKDASSRVIAMEQGEGHMYPFVIDSRDIIRFEKAKNLVVEENGYAAVGAITWLAFNTKKPPLDDVRVRQAIAYAVDRNFIINALHRGMSKPATGPIAPGSPFYTDEVARYDVDLDKAKALLDEAGHPANSDGVRFTLEVDHIPAVPEQQKAIAEYLKPQLKKVGIDVQVRNSPDFPTWAKRVSSHEFDMTMDIVFNWGDPVIGVHRTYLTSNIRKGVIWSNTQSYSNPDIDALLEKAGLESDLETRRAHYVAFQKKVAEDLPIYWLNTLPYRTVYSQDIGNAPTTIWGAMSPLDEVYWKKQPN